MHFGTDKTRLLASGRRRAFRPVAQVLEDRLVMAVDLSSVATAPLGVLMAGNIGAGGIGPAAGTGGGAGFSVSELGDVNGDGFDDFMIGGPGIAVNANGLFELSSGSNSMSYLVFGSREVNNPQAIDFALLNANQRIGDLGTLGNALQNNPLTGNPGFAFNGITFRAGQQTLGQLGASVTAVGDINGDGFADFMIGAPGATGPNGITAGAGRAYLVYGGANLTTLTNKTVDLDNVLPTSGVNVITFIGADASGRAGRAVAGVGDIIPNGLPDIAIGAPFASVNGLSGSGAVYLIDGSFLRPARSQTVNLADVGQPGGAAQSGLSNQNSILFGGANPGSEAGTSIAGAGDFDADGKADLLIGAASGSTGGAGAAYLVYGAGNLTSQSAAPANGVFSINLSRVGNTGGTTPGVRGAVFTGVTGDVAGFSLSSAGDFNNDGVSDILIGSPGYNNLAGRVSLIYGSPATPATPGAIVGTFPLNNLPTAINAATFVGQGPNSLAGYSVSNVGRINTDPINEIAIGAPGVNGGSGAVYVLPGNPNLLTGTITLNAAGIEIPTIAGQTITLSQPVGTNFLGTSVSGRPYTGSRTIDNDTISDLVLGAAGYALNSTRNLAGAGFVVEGRFLQLGIPVSTAITSDISVGTSVNPPYVVNANTPADLVINILSRARSDPNFEPARDIDPSTIKVNGVALPNPSTFHQIPDIDGDGVPDASFTFSPRTLLNLTTATTTLDVTARTIASSPLGGGKQYSGTAAIQVTGGGGGGGGGLPVTGASAGSFFFNFVPTPPPFSGKLPRPFVLSKLRYKPIPLHVAMRQFVPAQPFAQRTYNFDHPTNQKLGTGSKHEGHKTITLGGNVFTRGRFKAGQLIRPIHHGPRGGLRTIPPTLR